MLHLEARPKSAAMCAMATIASVIVAGMSAGPARAVYNGAPATITTYPWVVSVQAHPSSGGTDYCDGTVVADRWVLTAAHCVTTWPSNNGACATFLGIEEHTCRLFATKPRIDLPDWKTQSADRVTVYVGSADRRTGTAAGVDRIAVAPYFAPILRVGAPTKKEHGLGPCPAITCQGLVSFRALSGDVALLHTSTSLTTPHIALDDSAPSDGTNVRVIGWGDTSSTEAVTLPFALQESPNGGLHLEPASRCIASDVSSYVLPDQILCAGGNSTTGTGGGDSGGPLLVRRTDGSYSETGIVSFGPSTGTTSDSQPDKFAEIHGTNFKWINRVINAGSAAPRPHFAWLKRCAIIDEGSGGFHYPTGIYPARNVSCAKAKVVFRRATHTPDRYVTVTHGHNPWLVWRDGWGCDGHSIWVCLYRFRNPIRGVTRIAYSAECGAGARCPTRLRQYVAW